MRLSQLGSRLAIGFTYGDPTKYLLPPLAHPSYVRCCFLGVGGCDGGLVGCPPPLVLPRMSRCRIGQLRKSPCAIRCLPSAQSRCSQLRHQILLPLRKTDCMGPIDWSAQFKSW